MNLNIWDIMAPAFFECLILVGIHSYLGLHVLRRKVIFVDLALAQIAALGTTVGFLFGIMPGSMGAYWFSLLFTFIGAAIFSISRIRHEKIPQEAVIGLAYAVAAAVAILVIDKAPHGAEHIKEIMTGSILWVKWVTIRNAAIVYTFIGIFHYIFRRQFILISEDPQKAYENGMSVRFWDFLFYVSFGIVITHSVGTAGVLLVFVFLVVPAITSMLITDILWKQLVIGWIMGILVSFGGLYISYSADLPSGPTVVSFYGVTLVLVALYLFIKRAELRKKAIMKVALGLGVTLIVVFGFYLLGNAFSESHAEGHEHTNVEKQITSIHDSHDNVELNELSEIELKKYLAKVIEVSELTLLFHHEKDEYTRLKVADRMIEVNEREGYLLMISVLQNGELPFVREKVLQNIWERSKMEFNYDATKSEDDNKAAIKKMIEWVKVNIL